MKLQKNICGLVAGLALVLAGHVSADERADDALPAAVKALNVSAANVVSAKEASEIRGQGGGFWIYGGSAVGKINVIEGALLNVTGTVGKLNVDGQVGGSSIGIWSGSSDVKVNTSGKFIVNQFDFNGNFRLDLTWPK